MYSATIVLSSTGENGDNVVKRIQVGLEVSSLYLEGSGTLPDPYSCRDVILLAANDGTVWTETYYWVSGYVLGVNPFNQPGVESYKKNTFALLGKPGYEEMKEALEARLK